MGCSNSTESLEATVTAVHRAHVPGALVLNLRPLPEQAAAEGHIPVACTISADYHKEYQRRMGVDESVFKSTLDPSILGRLHYFLTGYDGKQDILPVKCSETVSLQCPLMPEMPLTCTLTDVEKKDFTPAESQKPHRMGHRDLWKFDVHGPGGIEVAKFTLTTLELTDPGKKKNWGGRYNGD